MNTFHSLHHFLLQHSVRTREKSIPPSVYLNHIYVVLDSITLQHLFDSPYKTDTLGDGEADSTITNSQSDFVKYLHGKNGYFELLPIKAYKNALASDIEMGLITFKTGDIWLASKDSLLQISIWLQENTMEHMRLVGFSEAEMEHENCLRIVS